MHEMVLPVASEVDEEVCGFVDAGVSVESTDPTPEFDEDLVGSNVDELRAKQKLDSVSIISSMRMKPLHLSRHNVPLCRMAFLPCVRICMPSDVNKLEDAFVGGYREGARVFYLSLTDESDQECALSDDDIAGLSSLWRAEHDKYEAFLESHPELHSLRRKKLFVCNGNHRLMAWTQFINRLHSNDAAWHINVDSIILSTRGRMNLAVAAMHDINEQTQGAHVKSNLVHDLYRVQKYGLLPLGKFKDLLSESEFKRSKAMTNRSWYTLPALVFAAFLHKKELADCADEAARRIEKDDVFATAAMKAEAMRVACKEKLDKLISRLSKLTGVANPLLGNDFLNELKRHWSIHSSPEMTLDRLQMVATAQAAPEYKVQWLQWWNSSAFTREAKRFPKRPLQDNVFKSWLLKACFYVTVDEHSNAMLESIIKDDGISIGLIGDATSASLSAYLESWRTIIWDHGFLALFKGQAAFTKSTNFIDFDPRELVVKRVVWRYFKFELLDKGYLNPAAPPTFMSSFTEIYSSTSMYSQSQMKTWPSSHLKGGYWYLDCGGCFTPESEVPIRESLPMLGDSVHDEDEFSGMNEEQVQKVLEKRAIADARKATKLVEKAQKQVDGRRKANDSNKNNVDVHSTAHTMDAEFSREEYYLLILLFVTGVFHQKHPKMYALQDEGNDHLLGL